MLIYRLTLFKLQACILGATLSEVHYIIATLNYLAKLKFLKLELRKSIHVEVIFVRKSLLTHFSPIFHSYTP